MPGRKFDTDGYRYGFQGQEKDDEIKGEGNSVNYKYRMHDPRIGRFFAVDPLTSKYPHYSPYSFSGNKVIQFVELEGLEEARSAAQDPNMGLTMAIDGVQSGTIIQKQLNDLQAKNEKPNPNPANLSVNWGAVMSYSKYSVGVGTFVSGKLLKNDFWISKTKASGYSLKVLKPNMLGQYIYPQKKGIARLSLLNKVGKSGGYLLQGLILAPDALTYMGSDDEEAKLEAKSSLIKNGTLFGVGLLSPPTGLILGTGSVVSALEEEKLEESKKKVYIERANDFTSPNNYEYYRKVKENGYDARDMTNDKVEEKKL